MSDANETHQPAEHAVRNFFKNPDVSKAVCDMLLRKKPMGWSRRSNTAYYKEPYGIAMKEVVLEMIRTRQDQVYFYKDFPEISPTTLYLKVNMSIRYMLDFLDDENKTLARWNEMIQVCQEHHVGVRLKFIEGLRDGKLMDFKPRTVMPKNQIPKWKIELEEYLEDSRHTKPLHIDKLALTTAEMEEVKASLAGLKGIIYNVKAFEIKVIKTN